MIKTIKKGNMEIANDDLGKTLSINTDYVGLHLNNSEMDLLYRLLDEYYKNHKRNT